MFGFGKKKQKVGPPLPRPTPRPRQDFGPTISEEENGVKWLTGLELFIRDVLVRERGPHLRHADQPTSWARSRTRTRSVPRRPAPGENGFFYDDEAGTISAGFVERIEMEHEQCFYFNQDAIAYGVKDHKEKYGDE